ncbi:MAG: hypothetical protein LCH56_04500 [Proteobacteria bacterium]|nr:hypothetical protein [Pseudomonadota bacterium]
MSLKSVILELARNSQAPHGDRDWRYEFRAPLDERGYFDPKAWDDFKELCTVRRFQNGALAETGLLCRTAGGRFFFSYRPGFEDDEPVFRFADHRFAPGEYVTITEHDGVARTFRVVGVNHWSPRAEARSPAPGATRLH